MHTKHLVIVGAMGVGKSSVGRVLGRLLGMKVVDADAYLEQTVAPIDWIMDKEGETGFREYESRCLREIFERFGATPIIVTTGGGVVLREDNRHLLTSEIAATVVYLRADAALLAKRPLRMQSRPALAQSKDTFAFFTNMLQKRAPLFAEVADMSIDVAQYASTREIAKAIVAALP